MKQRTKTKGNQRIGSFLWRPFSLFSILLFAVVAAVPNIFAVPEIFLDPSIDNGVDGKSDLNGIAVEYTTTTLEIDWYYDNELQNGGNENDKGACVDLSTNDDQLVDYAVCYDPDDQETYLFTCGNSKLEGCAMNDSSSMPLPSGTCTETYVPELIVVDEYDNLDDNGNDTLISCSIDLSLFPTTPAILNVCTVQAESVDAMGTSQHKDCALRPVGTATLTLVKVINGGAATIGDFTLSAVDSVSGLGPSGVSGTVDVTDVEVLPGVYDLSESSTLLDSSVYTLTNLVCDDGSDSTSVLNPQVTLDASADVTCTFTNSVQEATINVVKNLDNGNVVGGAASVASFSHTVTPAVASNVAFVASADPLTSETASYDVIASNGPFDITEDGVADGRITIDGITYNVTYSGDCANVDAQPGQAYTCTITNTAIETRELTVAKSADVTYFSAVDDVINYTITVVNDGNVTQSMAEVEAAMSDTLNDIDDVPIDDLFGPFESLDPDVDATGDLGVDETWYYTFSYTIVQADIDRGSVTNVVCEDADGDGTDECSEVETPLAALDIVKTVTAIDGDPDGVANSVGDVIDYEIVVTNVGAVDLAPTLTDILSQSGVTLQFNDPGLVGPDESQGDDGVMEPTETWTYTASYTLTQADIDDGGDIVNEACALNVDPAVAQECSEVSTPIEQTLNATVSKSADVTYYSAEGDVINYTIRVDNTGNVSLSQADVEATLSDSLNGNPVTLAGPFSDAAGTTPAIGDLAVSGTWYYTYSYTILASDLDNGDSVTNVVCIDADGDGTPQCDTVETPSAGLDIVKTVTAIDGDPDGVANSVGDVIDYEIVVTNVGAVDLAPTLTDVLSQSGIRLQFDDPPGLVGPTESQGDDDVMEPTETWTYTASYTLMQADIDNGDDIVNQACALNVDPVVAQECSDVSTPIVRTPNATVSKSADVTYYSAEGDVINYTIQVDNTGNVSLSQADVEATLSDELNGVDVTDDLAGPFTDATGTIPAVDDLAVSGTWYYTYSYTIVAADLDNGDSVTNVVCIDADGDGTPQCSQVETPSAGLDIVKTVESVTGGTAGVVDSAGDIINYSVVVINTGGVDLTPMMSDFLSQSGVGGNFSLVGPTESISDDLILQVGETWSFTLQYEVSQANINNGDDIVNEACALNVDPAVAQECSEVSTPIEQTLNATVSKSADVTYYSAEGDVINYTIRVDNTGNVSLSQADVEATLSDSLNGNPVTLAGPFSDAAGTTPAIGDLAVSGTWYYTYSYTILASDLDNGDSVTNVVCIDADGDGTPQCDTVETPSAGLDIVKTVTAIDGDPDGVANSVGDVIDYEIVVTNVGAIDLAPTLTDILSQSGVTLQFDDPGLVGPDESQGDDSVMEPTETWTYTASYTLTQADIDNGDDIVNEACASNTDPNVAEECSDVTTPITQTPAMSVVKDVDQATIDGPTTLTYDITVTNDGNVTMYPSMSDILNASGVDSSIDLGTPTESLNTDGDLDVGETWTFQFTYDVTQGDIDDGRTILNTVCIVDPVEDADVDDCDDAETEITQTPAMSVVKDVDQATIDGPTTLTYDITVTNDGNVTMYPSMSDILNASGVDSSIDLGTPTESLNTDGDLDVGETWTFQFTYDVTQGDIDDGRTILNTVCIVDPVEDADVDDCDDAETEITQTPAMSVVKDVDQATIDGPTTLTYDITVTNDGNVTMYPSMSDILNASGVDSSIDLGTPTESLNTDGDLDVGETWTFQFTYDVTQGDIDDGRTILNTVCIVDPVEDADVDDCDDAETEITQTPAMSVVKDVDQATIDGPTTLTYDITVTNDGNVTMYPSMSDILNASGVDSSIDLGTPTESLNTDGDLDVGETWTFQFTYDVTQGDIDDGRTILNTVCIVDPVEDADVDDCDDAETEITQTPAMSVVKDVDQATIDGPTTLTYDITVTNDGNVTMYPSMSDILNASGVDSSIDLGTPTESLNTDGDLDVGETWTFQFTYDVTQGDIDDGRTILNTVCIVDPVEDADVDDCDDAETEITQTPAMSVVKDVDQATIDGPTTLTYDITVTNDGNVTMYPSMSDILNASGVDSSIDLGTPTESLNTDGDLDVGETWTFQFTYDVTQGDIDDGRTILNTVCIVDPVEDADVDDCDDAETEITQTPAMSVVKDVDQATIDGPTTLTYDITVTNDGNVTMYPSMSDILNASGVDSSIDLGTPTESLNTDGDLDVGETWTFQFTYDVTQGDIDDGRTILNTVCIVDPVEDADVDDCDDAETEITQTPAMSVVKDVDQATIDGPTTLTYDITVTNDGNVTMYPSMSDILNASGVDSSIDLGTPTESLNTDGDLDVGETWTFQFTYDVTQGDIDDGRTILNTVCIVDPVEDADVDDCDDAETEITQTPAHTLVKTFVPDEVGIGETGTFTLVYMNTGNVTLSDIEITDTVEPILDIQMVTTSVGSCPNGDGNDQTITCNVGSLAPGASMEITVTYVAAPLVDDLVPDTSQTSGADYVFYFENGYVLYGSTGGDTAYLQDPEGVVTDADVEGRNQDIYFNVPFGGDGFQLHLSCSEVFIDGWGDTGPIADEDPDWRIDAYEVHRFNTNGFFKDCGQSFAPFEVDNEASATATPAGGILTPNPITAEDTVTLISIAPIEVSRERVRRGDVEIQYFNTSYDEIEIDIIRVEWTDGSVLESASYRDGVDLGISGGSPAQASIDTIMPARSKDWLRLSFDSGNAPEGLTIIIVTSTGATLTYEFGS